MREEIAQYFSGIEDTRCQCDVKHPLVDVLILVMCAVISGLDVPCKIVEYGLQKAEMLREQFGVQKTPSESTLSRILSMVNGDVLSSAIIAWMRDKLGIKGDIIAVDGKTICSTVVSSVCRKLHILTAMLTANGVTLAQLATDEKSNEIPKMRELLALIDIEGKIITSDAMGCQRETAKQIIEQKGDYCLGLKGNQQQLHDDVELYFETFQNDPTLFDVAVTKEKSRDRFEIRRCYVFNDISWLEGREKWEGLKTVLAIRRTVTKDGKKTTETLFYISSLEAGAERFLQIVRDHWQIEAMHNILDVTFNEDKCRVQNENAHKTLNAFRKLAIALHKGFKERANHKKSLAKTMFSCLLNDDRLLEIVKL